MNKPRHNKTALVSNSRWLAYVAAGAATSLSGTHSAEAEIHYSGVINAHFETRYHHNGTGNFPLRHSARLHFFEYNTYARNFSINGAAVSNRLCQYQNPRFGGSYISRLSRGDVVSNCDFDSTDRAGVLFSSYGYRGKFAIPGIGFIPFRFNNGAGMQYGWARIYRIHSPSGYVLVDYAWGDPGDQVRAGQTSSAGDEAEAVPDQGSLGLLALGSAGSLAWRRRRG